MKTPIGIRLLSVFVVVSSVFGMPAAAELITVEYSGWAPSTIVGQATVSWSFDLSELGLDNPSVVINSAVLEIWADNVDRSLPDNFWIENRHYTYYVGPGGADLGDLVHIEGSPGSPVYLAEGSGLTLLALADWLSDGFAYFRDGAFDVSVDVRETDTWWDILDYRIGSNYYYLLKPNWDGSLTFVNSRLTIDFSIPDEEGPVVSGVVADLNPVAVNTDLAIYAVIDDSATGGSTIASAECSIDGGPWLPVDAMDAAFDQVSEDVMGLLPGFLSPGLYTICVRGTDFVGNTGSEECIIVAAYDPEGGFVTGGGWIDSPEGAFAAAPWIAGKATFGFLAKYKKGASEPVGQTEFQFRVAGLNFHSASYDWLVVAGARAQFKGIGTVNGVDGFGFMLTAGDGDLKQNPTPDKFRIKIWDRFTDEIIYDNQIGDDDTAEPSTVIGGGNIVVHKGN